MDNLGQHFIPYTGMTVLVFYNATNYSGKIVKVENEGALVKFFEDDTTQFVLYPRMQPILDVPRTKRKVMITSKTASIQTKVKRAKLNELALLANNIPQFRHLSLETQKVIASGRKPKREPVMRGEVITDDYVKFLSKKLHERNKDRELGAV